MQDSTKKKIRDFLNVGYQQGKDVLKPMTHPSISPLFNKKVQDAAVRSGKYIAGSTGIAQALAPDLAKKWKNEATSGIGSSFSIAKVERPQTIGMSPLAEGDRRIATPAQPAVEEISNSGAGTIGGYEITPGPGMKPRQKEALSANNSSRFANIDADILAKSDRAHQEQYMRRIEGGGMIPIHGGGGTGRYFGPTLFRNEQKKSSVEDTPLEGGWESRMAMRLAKMKHKSDMELEGARQSDPMNVENAASVQLDNQQAPIRKKLAGMRVQATEDMMNTSGEAEDPAESINLIIQEILKARKKNVLTE